MIGYFVPHSLFPAGYHCDPKQPLPFAGLASQKNHMSLYLMCVYGVGDHSKQFQQAWAKTGKGLDMGKSCIRFKKVEDLALEVIAETVRRVPASKWIDISVEALRGMGKGPGWGKPLKDASKGAAKQAGKKAAAKKVVKKTGKRAAKTKSGR